MGDTAWSEYYFAKNLQGDVIGVYRASDNAQVAFYEYDAWGNIISKSGAMADINPFRYRTYYYDNETWFYYLQSRYYDPAIGRFINADDVDYLGVGSNLTSYNLFTYCLNNPANYFDSNGRYPEALYWWLGTMWWLPAVDTLLFVGDIIFVGGIVVLGVYTFVMADQHSSYQTLLENGTNDVTEKGEVVAGDPPTEKDGYKAPKGGPKKGKTKDGKTGWVDKHGNIWVPVPSGTSGAHGGGHWDVQRADGKGYSNVYPGGKVRPGSGKPPTLSFHTTNTCF